MVKHTPGPWMSPDGVHDLTVWATKNGRTELIASTTTNQWCKQDEAFANARLMAAAPELLEVLKLIEANLEGHYKMGWGNIDIDNAYEAAKAAIAKATGEKEVQP